MQHLVCAIFIFQTRSRACLKNQRKVSENLVFHMGNFYNKRRIV